MDSIKTILSSRAFRKLSLIIVGAIVILLIFQAGVFVGFHKASFSNRWGENYRDILGLNRSFRSAGRTSLREVLGGDYLTSHGAVGKIIKIELPKFIVVGNDNVEKIINTTDDTTILQFRNKIKTTDLKLDDYIVVIGSPNNKGEVEAKLIRVIPNSMMLNVSTTPVK